MRIELTSADLEPLIEQVARKVVAELWESEAKVNGRLGFTEAEAAATIGVARHVLRDARLRGEIQGRKVGKQVVYAADALIQFLTKEG